MRRFRSLHSLRMSQVLAEAEDDQEGRQEPYLVHLETVRVRDLQETLPLCLPIKWDTLQID